MIQNKCFLNFKQTMMMIKTKFTDLTISVTISVIDLNAEVTDLLVI
jgi:hypothetical protein